MSISTYQITDTRNSSLIPRIYLSFTTNVNVREATIITLLLPVVNVFLIQCTYETRFDYISLTRFIYYTQKLALNIN